MLRKLVNSHSWELSLVAIVILELVIFGILQPDFVNPTSLLQSTSDFAYLGVVAFPLAVVMLTGGIDISIGSIASLSAITCGVVFAQSGSIALGCVCGLVAGVIAGILNAVLIIGTGAHPMVITLGTQFLFAGIALGMSGLGGVSAFEGISGIPDGFQNLTNAYIGGVPAMLLWFVLAAIGFLVLISYTPTGARIQLFGSNPSTAHYAGISPKRVILVVYSLSGLVAAFGGLLLVSYTGSARADIGATLLMPVLTLVVIGGISMYGGEGTIFGVIVATFVIGFLTNGLRYLGMDENQVAVVTGSVLVIVSAARWWSRVGAEKLRNRKIRTLIKTS